MVKKLDKLKRLRYELSMKIIDLESRAGNLSNSDKKTLEILVRKESELNEKIANFK